MWTVNDLKRADVINLGSTYAFFDLDYDRCKLKGVNLASCPQYLEIDYLLIKKYGKQIKKGSTVLIVLPDFVFIADSELLSINNMNSYSRLGFMEYGKNNPKLFLKAKEKYIKDKIRNIIKKNAYVNATCVNKCSEAKRRIELWKNSLGIEIEQDIEVDEIIKKRMKRNVELLDDIVDFCILNGLKPVLLIPPMSDIMRSMIPTQCIDKYLFGPLSERKNKTIPLLNYLEEKCFRDESLYWNADCLNKEGAYYFTQRVLRDLELI